MVFSFFRGQPGERLEAVESKVRTMLQRLSTQLEHFELAAQAIPRRSALGQDLSGLPPRIGELGLVLGQEPYGLLMLGRGVVEKHDVLTVNVPYLNKWQTPARGVAARGRPGPKRPAKPCCSRSARIAFSTFFHSTPKGGLLSM